MLFNVFKSDMSTSSSPFHLSNFPYVLEEKYFERIHCRDRLLLKQAYTVIVQAVEKKVKYVIAHNPDI